jgi:hypothetical protein
MLRIYRVPAITKLMTWHNKNWLIDGKVHHALDNKTWAHINATWPEFVDDPSHIQLGLLQMDLIHLGKRVQVG